MFQKVFSPHAWQKQYKNAIKNLISILRNSQKASLKSTIKVDTIYIHDTIQIKEKKNFWGKVKTDTTN